MTKTNGKKLSAKDHAVALLGSCAQIVAGDTRDRPQLEVLIRALQGFKDKTLAHVYARSIDLPDQTQRHRLFSERLEDLAFLAPKLQKYLKARGIRYLGEVYYVHFDYRSHHAVMYGEEILGALSNHLGLPRDFDPLQDGWTPPYWNDPTFRQILSAPVIEVLGDQPFERWSKQHYIGYSSPARSIHHAGHHYVGVWMQNLRQVVGVEQSRPTSAWGAGKLEHLESQLRDVPQLRAGMLVPSDWHAPEGVPEVWTRLLNDVILPAIAAWENRRQEEGAERQSRREERRG